MRWFLVSAVLVFSAACQTQAPKDATTMDLMHQSLAAAGAALVDLRLQTLDLGPLAAEAAHEVYKQNGSDAFWKYHDKLFQNQKAPGGIQRANLEKFAEPWALRSPRRSASSGSTEQTTSEPGKTEPCNFTSQ